ncbi:WecB/TagA/CpsF family glycosyltransferase [uncultured Cyclobacterium sp.]|uniref:WecB/TagA/CpsF family glycosyltransferase n=1 Tax=uncultured Cyclobacterium sp. TaxID=453820 RepID=UPI0030EB5C11|tara:strand:- start:108114 stop:108914 length:801 start_codon:yes stop_codon:yes gene_type:complete
MIKLAYPKNRINEYQIFSQELVNLPSEKKMLIQTLNQYSYCLTKEDPEFKASLLGADVVLPDGIAIVLANWLINGTIIKKIAGADLHQYLLGELNSKGGRVFYLGSTENTLNIIKIKSNVEYPNIQVGLFSPAFKSSFDSIENQQMIDAVNDFNPDILFVGMTAPKQEKWAFANKEFLNVPVICSIGAVFDFYAGTVRRPSKLWVNCGLEWLVRFAKEPSRMWVRYGYYGPIFFKDLFLEYFSRTISKKEEKGRFKNMKEFSDKME